MSYQSHRRILEQELAMAARALWYPLMGDDGIVESVPASAVDECEAFFEKLRELKIHDEEKSG